MTQDEIKMLIHMANVISEKVEDVHLELCEMIDANGGLSVNVETLPRNYYTIKNDLETVGAVCETVKKELNELKEIAEAEENGTEENPK